VCESPLIGGTVARGVEESGSVGGIVSVDAVSLLKRNQFALSSSHLGGGCAEFGFQRYW